MRRHKKDIAPLLLAGLVAGATSVSPAGASSSWAYWFADADNQAECLDKSEASVRQLRSQSIAFKIDTYTDTVIELEVDTVDGRRVSTTALLLCSERQVTITVFGDDYGAIEAVRDGLRDGYSQR